MHRGGFLGARGGRVLGAFCLVSVGLLTQGFGCAQPTEGDGAKSDENEGGAGGTGAGTPTTSSSGGGSGTTTTTGVGGSGGGSTSDCPPPQHMCGGLCVDGTPQNGCYASSSCTSCPTVANGNAVCTADGQCDIECAAGYQESNGACTCPSQCCSNADCGGSGYTCNGGTCQCSAQCCSDAQCAATEACDGGTCACESGACLAYCVGMGMIGTCFPVIGCQCAS